MSLPNLLALMPALLPALPPALFAEAFTLWGGAVTWLEVAAFALSLWMVACNMRVHILGWPLAIASSVLYGLLFAHSQLYGEAGLQLFFIALAGWGWWQWWRGSAGSTQPLTVQRLLPHQRGVIAALTLAAWPLLGAVLARSADSTVPAYLPYLDALATVGSVTATLLLGRKRLENWPLWLAVNLFSVGLFAVKGLWLTVILYALFAVLSVLGWRAWRALLVAAPGAARGTPAGSMTSAARGADASHG